MIDVDKFLEGEAAKVCTERSIGPSIEGCDDDTRTYSCMRVCAVCMCVWVYVLTIMQKKSEQQANDSKKDG